MPPKTIHSVVRIGDLLLKKGLIDESRLEEALDEQKRNPFEKLGETLVRLEFIQEEDLLQIIAEQFDIPWLMIDKGLYDPEIFGIIPPEFCERHQVLPLFKVGDTLSVAVVDPLNIFVVDSLKRLTGLKVQAAIATGEDISRTIRQILNSRKAFMVDEIIDNLEEDDIRVVERQIDEIENIEEMAGLSPVVRLVNFVIYKAIREGASDIHIEPDEGTLRVRYRMDGILLETLRPPIKMQAALVSRLKIMANLDISERRLPQDGRMQVMLENRLIDLRISTIPTYHGEKVVIRILDKESMLKELDKLGFGYEMLEEFVELIQRPNGILLVTGPTGSGKTTTLYSAIKRIISVQKNICTVENPIEYNLRMVNQIQVNEKAGLTFSGCLRALLRQDPDIIMVGEIRDAETAQIAAQAALTGHLVLSTLHTNDAMGAVMRCINMGMEPYLLASSLLGVLAQRLVRTICPACKEEIPVPKTYVPMLRKKGLDYETVFQGKGCQKCHRSGYSGRIGLYELVAVEDRLRDLIS
ncbi:MAG: GspE/PulE family protein, partial [Planctomycetes bacterium]|nr:GspE/PulE family protein [Planctomycetota bacterium]